MKKSSLLILLITSSIMNAQAMWNGDDERSGAHRGAVVRQSEPMRVDEGLVRYQYRGGVAHRIRGQVIHEENGVRRANIAIDGEIVGHEGNKQVYVEPIDISNEPGRTFDGRYDYISDLSHNQKLPGRENGRLIYSNGEHYFIPTITQELWQQEDMFQAGFFIASYNSKNKVSFIQGATIPNGRLNEGLYALISLENKATGREETWRRLDPNPENVIINVPSGCASIPGMGALAPVLVPSKPQIPNGVVPGTDVPTLGEGLNRYFADYLKLEGARRLIHYCRVKIDQHQGTSAGLRQEFTSLAETLQGLRHTAAYMPMNFVNSLKTFMNIDELEPVVNQIGVLKNQNQGITYQTVVWGTALDDVIQKIRNIATPPTPTFENGVLSLKGTFLGVSDLLQAYQQNPTATEICGFGLNTLYLDVEQEVIAPGVIVKLIAPKWKFISPFHLNLSGSKGVTVDNGMNGADNHPGEDGQPGNPGMNGGHFYGQFFTSNRIDLTVKSHGGEGGNGGNGGNGGKGSAGKHGRTFFGKKVGKFKYDYFQEGTSGKPGCHGGKGGKCGLGGKAGTIELVGGNWTPNASDKIDGTIGEDGRPGQGGLAGAPGLSWHWYSHRPLLFANAQPTNIHVMLAYSDNLKEAKKVDNGKTPTALNIVEPQNPSPNVVVDKNGIKAQYRTWYQQQSVNVSVSPFIRVLPAFSEPQ